MLKWKRQPQEKEGTYRFSGKFVVTQGISHLLSEAEVMLLYWETRFWVEQLDGLDYLQVFAHKETGQKLFFIDQLNDEMKANGGFSEGDDHCTLLLAEEY